MKAKVQLPVDYRSPTFIYAIRVRRFCLLLPLLWLCATFPTFAAAPDLKIGLEALSSKGNGEAAYHLGMIHHVGLNGTPKDPRKALDLFRLAAERGDPLGAYKPGCYYDGQGQGIVADDAEMALRYKLVVAEAGYSLAQADLAEIYAERKDFRTGGALARSGSETGRPAGLDDLGLYHSGKHPYLPGSKDTPREFAYTMLFLDRAGDSLAPMKAEVERELRAKMSAEEIAKGMALIAQWRAKPTPLSEKAGAGLEAARTLLAKWSEGEMAPVTGRE